MHRETEDHSLAKFFPAGRLKKTRPKKKVRKTRSDKGVKRGPREKLVLTPLDYPDS